MKVLKFGGKSLANGLPLESTLQIIESAARISKIFVVLSARADATDILEKMIHLAASGDDYQQEFDVFFNYQVAHTPQFNLADERYSISRMLEGVALLGEYSLKIKDQLLAYGELISCRTIVHLLQERGFKARFVDARNLIKTDQKYGSAQVLQELSRENFQKFFADNEPDTIEVVTGFIGSNLNNQTTTLGRNGSNYTATLVASFLEASEVQNWTNVNGLYTANPSIVPDAQIIRHLSFREANELANFGMHILHAKTILPLIEKKIPIRILNSFNPGDPGTFIDEEGDGKGIKAISAIQDVALVSIEGRGLLGKVGIDGRIFSALSAAGISVRIISQASSERGIGFIIDAEHSKLASKALNQEFYKEIELQDINDITINKEVAVISIISRNLQFLDIAYSSLNRNNIKPILMANTINGDHISLVVSKQQMRKAVNIIHGHIFGATKRLNVFLFGKGNVGKTLLNQLVKSKVRIKERRGLLINIFGICDSKKLLLRSHDLGEKWLETLEREGVTDYSIDDIFSYISKQHLENVVVVDNTASVKLAEDYPLFIQNGCDIVASNKHANTFEMGWYNTFREQLQNNHRQFYYETNVGAGLPLIDTIKLLHASGDFIYKIRGVFSGSLSYIFNKYSESKLPFFSVLKEAIEKGLTEPDPREDLSGKDVGRKLLILARELDLNVNFQDVHIESLIPASLRHEMTKEEFITHYEELNAWFESIKEQLNQDEVLRYVGELDSVTGRLEVKLDRISSKSDLGSLSGADSIFEIYTEAYGEHPLVIRGAGAGAEVTARGVFSDLLRLASV